MDKYQFGKLIGEVYRIQNRQGYSPVSEGRIYGLLNGIETAIDDEINSLSPISNEELESVMNIFAPYWNDEEKLEEITGYYDLEDQFTAAGLSRGTMIKILTYFKANRQYDAIIDKFNSGNSPTECKTFKLYDEDK